MHYYKRHLGDYAKDTRHLTLLQHGAYTLLLDWYYSSEHPIPANRCDRIANASTPTERQAVRFVLTDFFVETPDGWISRRADAEIAAMRAKSDKAANSAKARWVCNQAMRSHSERNAAAELSQCDGNASHYPLSIKEQHQKKEPREKSARAAPLARPTGVTEQTWADWLTLRKTKKASVTPTVVASAEREAAKAGMAIEDFLVEWCARGSQGLKAEWINQTRGQQNADGARGSNSNHRLSAVERVKAANERAEQRDRDTSIVRTVDSPGVGAHG